MTIIEAAAVDNDLLDGRLLSVADLAQAMFAQTTLQDTLVTVTDLAQRTFGCDGAGILLTSDAGSVTGSVATTPQAERADALQVESRQGPGLQTIARRQPVITTELRFDGRWRFWAPQAADLGFRSVLSLSLVDEDLTGALNLYSRRASFFHSDVLALGQAFARHASIAIAIARERGLLLQTVDSRTMVGQAQGIMMERYDMSADQALVALRRYAAHLGQPVRLMAEHVIRERSLPEIDPAEAKLTLAAAPEDGQLALELPDHDQRFDPTRI